MTCHRQERSFSLAFFMIFFGLKSVSKLFEIISLKGYFHLCPRMDFFQTLHINNSLFTNYEKVFIELDS